MTTQTPRRNKRRLWFAFAALVVVVVLAAIGIETFHRRTWDHYVGFGVHTHLLRQSVDIGIPGVGNMYSVTATNYTPLPILMHGCKGPSDVNPFYEITYRYQVEKWESASATWSKIMAMTSECPGEALVTQALAPGATMEIVEPEATGARDGLHKGDLVRFTVFASFNEGDESLGQRIINSQAFIIEDEKVETGVQYRISH